MVRQTTKVIVLEVLGVVSLLLMAAVAVLAFMLANGPVDLGIFREDIEQVLTKARDGREVGIEQLTLQWSPGDRRLLVVANNVSFKGAQGEEAGHADRADLTLDAGAFLLGDIELLRLHMEGGWLGLQNTASGGWLIVGEPLPSFEAQALPQTPREWLDRANTSLSSVLTGLAALQETADIETLSFDNMIIRYKTADGVEAGRLEGASGGFERSETDISLAFQGEGEGLGLPGHFEVSLATNESYRTLRADIMVQNWPVSDLAGRFGLSGLQAGGLTADFSVGAAITRDRGVQRIDIKIDRNSGDLSLPSGVEPLQELNLDLSYVIDEDTIEINTFNIASDRLTGVFTGQLHNILSETALRRLELSAPDIQLHLRELYADPWQFGDFDLAVDISDDFSVFGFDRIGVSIGDTILRATGEVDLDVEHEDGQFPLKLNIVAEIVGDLEVATILEFWPKLSGKGARNFAVQRILQGVATEATATINLSPDSFAEGYLRDEDLLVKFSYRDLTVKFLNSFPAATNATGTGQLTGNSFSAIAMSADYDDWKIDGLEVNFPILSPAGENFTVRATGSGPILSILKQLSDSPLRLQEQTGFDPERVTGDATAELFLSRPSWNVVPFEDIILDVQGTVSNAGLRDVVGELDLTESSINIDITHEHLIITGFGDLGGAPVQFTWRDGLQLDDDPADLSATAIVSPDVLNTFGLVGRAYLTGEIPVEMQGEVGTNGLSKASYAFDLREARIDISEIGWVKPAGAMARATVTYTDDQEQKMSAIRLVSDTAVLEGDAMLGKDGRLQTLTLSRLFIDNTADVSGTLKRVGEDGIELTLTGSYLDLSPFIGEIGTVGGASDGLNLPLDFKAAVDRLKLRQGLELGGATLNLLSTSSGLKFIHASGRTANGSELEARFNAGQNGAASTINLKSGDAGFLASAFLDLDFVRGGELDLSGSLANGNQPARLVAKVKDARLTNAPFITQVLSLASLRGLSDTLSGDGVMFTSIDIPISIGGGRYVIDGGRASGPALGLTINGWIGADGQGIELGGVLVPSFGINSVLGGVPVIGDLFVGRKGEGIFSITYSVRGTLEKAQVAVNPLSAVTPGILRRIFENPSDTSIPDALPVDPNLKPPTPKLPELPDDEYIAPTPGGG